MKLRRPITFTELAERDTLSMMQSLGGGGFDYPLSCTRKYILRNRRYRIKIYRS